MSDDEWSGEKNLKPYSVAPFLIKSTIISLLLSCSFWLLFPCFFLLPPRRSSNRMFKYIFVGAKKIHVNKTYSKRWNVESPFPFTFDMMRLSHPFLLNRSRFCPLFFIVPNFFFFVFFTGGPYQLMVFDYVFFFSTRENTFENFFLFVCLLLVLEHCISFMYVFTSL